MKLGVCYNAFDGIELIRFSTQSIRKQVDFITVCYSTKSNCGNRSETPTAYILEELKIEGLIDDYFLFEPNTSIGAAVNELNKRNLGLERCKEHNCTHYMTIDVDECYKDEELAYVKKVMLEGDYDASACQMQTYYKSPEYCFETPEEYYVPLIYKITKNRFEHAIKWPVLADPTRKMRSNKFKIFSREEIEMHHYSYVRTNIATKYNNSTANINYKSKIDQLVDYWNNWKEGMDAYAAHNTGTYVKLKKVNNHFGIKI